MRRLGWLFLLLCGCDDAGGAADAGVPQPSLTLEQLLDPETCKDCHPDHYREWSGSMHAYAAEDPVFRAMNARGQRETGGQLGDFCIDCHAPLAVRLGLTTDGLNIDEVPPHLRGVTCAYCHQVDAVEGTHNNPLRLAMDGVMRGGIRDPVPNTAHHSAYSPLHDRNDLASAALCGSCHDIVTPAGVHLERTYAEWQGTIFNSDDPLQRNTCGTCHMEGRNAPVADAPGVRVRRAHAHTMHGVDVALTDFPEMEAQRALVQRDLDTTLTIELCVVAPGGVPISGGAEVELYLENIAAGHKVPSGAAQDRRMWVELIAYSGDTEVYRSGVVGDGEPIVEAAAQDPQLWLLYDRIFDANGDPVHMFWEAVDHEEVLLPPPSPLPPTDPAYENPHVLHRYRIISRDATIDRITARVRLRPMGLDVLDSLIESGDLDPTIRERMPTFTLANTVIEWTAAAAELRMSPATPREVLCVPRL